MSKSRVFTLALSLASAAIAGSAAAQDTTTTTTATTTATTPAPVAATATTAAPAVVVDTATNHSMVVGHLGASYFGQYDVPFGSAKTTVPTQVVGVRYWTSETMAIDVGIGFASVSGSTKSGSTTTDNPSVLGFTVMGGVPLSLLSAKHYTFFIEPQLRFGYASQSIKPAGGGDETKNTGYRVVVGATAGAEIQFGFIGLPHLALDATIGLGADISSATSKTGANPETTSSTTGIGTAAFNSPWNIFNSNVAARYYF